MCNPNHAVGSRSHEDYEDVYTYIYIYGVRDVGGGERRYLRDSR